MTSIFQCKITACCSVKRYHLAVEELSIIIIRCNERTSCPVYGCSRVPEVSAGDRQRVAAGVRQEGVSEWMASYWAAHMPRERIGEYKVLEKTI